MSKSKRNTARGTQFANLCIDGRQHVKTSREPARRRAMRIVVERLSCLKTRKQREREERARKQAESQRTLKLLSKAGRK